MVRITSPTIETTENLIVIKIPRNMFAGGISREKISSLERGLRESIEEANAGNLRGPFKSAKTFLHALKKPL